MQTRLAHRRIPSSRAGLTLVELLVVMAIMAVLCSMAFVMLGQTGQSAKRTATLTTIRKLDSLLQARLKELNNEFDQQDKKRLRKNTWINILFNAEVLKTGYDAGGNSVTPLALEGAKALTRIDRYQGAFPQRVADLQGFDGPAGSAVWAADSPLLAVWNGSNPVWNNKPRVPANHKPETENGELLYLAITIGFSAGAGKETLSDINPRHLQDTDDDGIPEFLDDWGHPLRFYNAPTRLIKPNGNASVPVASDFASAEILISGLPRLPSSVTDFTQSFNQDPYDPRGALRAGYFDSGWTIGGTTFDSFETFYHTPNTYYKPLIVSCGPDEVLGMGEPTATTPAAGMWHRLGAIVDGDGDGDVDSDDRSYATDNLTNLQRVGGK